MSNSFQQPDYLTISGNTSVSTGYIAQDVSMTFPDAVTMSSISIGGAGSSYYYNTGAGVGGLSGTISISGGGYTTGAVGSGTSTTFTMNDINPAPFTWKDPEEFVDVMPALSRITEMCEQYPGLKIAYEKFVTTYKLVKDHYDTPENERPIP